MTWPGGMRRRLEIAREMRKVAGIERPKCLVCEKALEMMPLRADNYSCYILQVITNAFVNTFPAAIV